jgi:hypothetical protein
MNQADVPGLLSSLSSDEDALRKMAVFKLQSSINDPAFADAFISSGGLAILRRLIMSSSGNTLAYSLQSLTRLLEVDMGWEIFEWTNAGELVERIVELIVTHPLVNILRGAMSILVAVVSHPQTARNAIKTPGAYGFRALKPAVAVYPQFFEMVVSQLHSADHALCGNALMLLNALIRDALTIDDGSKDGMSKVSGTGEEWPKFIKRLQDLGMIKAVYNLMQSSSLQDLAQPLLEFQALTKLLLHKWKEMRVDLERPEHRRALKGLHLASAPERKEQLSNASNSLTDHDASRKESRKHNPEKWRRLGFSMESPTWEFNPMGFLGLMDLTDYVRKNEDSFQKILLEQSSTPLHTRCPIARSSLAVTAILYEHFSIDQVDIDEARTYRILDGLQNYDKVFAPSILQWSRLHTAGLLAFLRLWKATTATQEDFDKVAELVRILADKVLSDATRTKDILDIEEELAEFEYHKLRELQMTMMEKAFDDQWGNHLAQAKMELENEATQFVREQRIRCLLAGQWFPRQVRTKGPSTGLKLDGVTTTWRFARLSGNRRTLLYSDYEHKSEDNPPAAELEKKIEISAISSVSSNFISNNEGDRRSSTSSLSSTSTIRNTTHQLQPSARTAVPYKGKITIMSWVDADTSYGSHSASQMSLTYGTTQKEERVVLTLAPEDQSMMSEWLDGLLMLLNQSAVTKETNRLIAGIVEYGIQLRLLNIRVEELMSRDGDVEERGVVPSREGTKGEFWYEL